MKDIQGLLIDIDDTLVKFADHYPSPSTASLLEVFKRAGVELAGLAEEEVGARIERVKKKVWWCWNDFIAELGLAEDVFWVYAFGVESAYLISTEAELSESLNALRESGLRLFITSNNPNPGIRHKMRLAGISDAQIDRLIEGILGATVMQNMKWEVAFWHKVIQTAGITPESLAVIGDSYHDDYKIPHQAGVGRTFLLNRNHEHDSQPQQDGLVIVESIREIVGLLSTRTILENTR